MAKLAKPKRWRKVHDDWQRIIYRFETRQNLWAEIGWDKKQDAYINFELSTATPS